MEVFYLMVYIVHKEALTVNVLLRSKIFTCVLTKKGFLGMMAMLSL